VAAKSIARVTGDLDQPRGPDLQHRISVPDEWLEQAATVEFELPRNLTCAACDGGGCDACERAGALSTRGRGEPAEVVRITLPRADSETPPPPAIARRGIVVRIPDQGGLPPLGSGLPRGHLMLMVQVGEPSGTLRVDAPVPEADQAAPAPRGATAPAPARRPRVAVLVLAAVVAAWVLFLIAVRASGCG
jgi:hypothetical protein